MAWTLEEMEEEDRREDFNEKFAKDVNKKMDKKIKKDFIDFILSKVKDYLKDTNPEDEDIDMNIELFRNVCENEILDCLTKIGDEVYDDKIRQLNKITYKNYAKIGDVVKTKDLGRWLSKHNYKKGVITAIKCENLVVKGFEKYGDLCCNYASQEFTIKLDNGKKITLNPCDFEVIKGEICQQEVQ